MFKGSNARQIEGLIRDQNTASFPLSYKIRSLHRAFSSGVPTSNRNAIIMTGSSCKHSELEAGS